MKKIILVMLVIASLISLVSADAGDSGCGFGMMTEAYGLGMGIFGWLFGILVIVSLVLLIVWLTKQIQKKWENINT